MGNGQRGKVPVYKNATSLSDGNFKSCVSAPLDDFVSFQEFWDTLVDLTKNPTGEHLQQQDIKQVSEHELEITKSLDLSDFDVNAMVKLGLQRLLLPTDQLSRWVKKDAVFKERYVIDAECHRICSERHGPSKNLMERSTTVVHQDPLRVEFWVEMPGWRRCGPVVSEAMRDRLLNPAIKRLHGDGYVWQMYKSQRAHKDFIQDASPAITHPGEKSVVSVALDAFAEFDTLWLATVDVLRYPDARPDKSYEIVEVDQMSEEEFMVRRRWDPEDPRVEGLADLDARDHVKLDRKGGTILAESYHNGALVNLTWYAIHRDPLRVECWCEGPPHRKAGSFIKQRLLVLLDIVLERCECAAGLDRNLGDFVSGRALEPADEEASEDEEGFAEPIGEEPSTFRFNPHLRIQEPSQQEKLPQTDGPSKILLHWRAMKEIRHKKREEEAKAIQELEERARKLGLEQKSKEGKEGAHQDDRGADQDAAQSQAKSSQEYFECED